MPDKEQLDKMLDSIIGKKEEQAEIHFHDYLQDKMQEVLYPEVKDSDDTDDKTEN